MKKHIISILFVALLAFVAGCSGGGNNPPPKEPETPASDFEYRYNAAMGGVIITKYIGNAIKVRIPEKIEGEPVVVIDGFRGSGIMEVYIPNSVTSIGYGAFQGCTGLTSIVIPDSVTSIGDEAFRFCLDLTATYKGKTYSYEPPPVPSPVSDDMLVLADNPDDDPDLPREFYDAVNGR